tara:strand:+ start:36 stop:155 length:120 start_codon:yes stop_codon:yes gene_type:complete
MNLTGFISVNYAARNISKQPPALKTVVNFAEACLGVFAR